MPTNKTTRYSQVSDPNGLLGGEELVAIAKPDPTNTDTGWNVFKAKVSALSFYFVAKFREEGMKGNISLGPGVLGDGSPGSLYLDQEYINEFAIRHDRLDITVVGNRANPRLPISARESPSTSFVVRTDALIPVQLSSAIGVIPQQDWDLTAYGAGPNMTIYWYAIRMGQNITSEIRTTPKDETLFETLMAVIKTNGSGIDSIVAYPFSRLGLYRLSETPIGNAVSCTAGSYANFVDKFWLTRWYEPKGGGGGDWDDIFIHEATITGPITQTMQLAPGKRFEILMYGPAGGGGGARHEDTTSQPTMNGQNAEATSIRIDGLVFVNFTNVAAGGTEGYYRNNFFSVNGQGGVGGNVQRENTPSGVAVNRYLSAAGRGGQGGTDYKWGGGARGTLTAPTGETIPGYLPTLDGYGKGGDGTGGIVTSERGLGAGGGGGAALYMEIQNNNTVPITIVVSLGAAGIGGQSTRWGQNGQQGAAWYRQMI